MFINNSKKKINILSILLAFCSMYLLLNSFVNPSLALEKEGLITGFINSITSQNDNPNPNSDLDFNSLLSQDLVYSNFIYNYDISEEGGYDSGNSFSSNYFTPLVSYDNYLSVVEAIKKYQSIKNNGGWSRIDPKLTFEIGDNNKNIADIKKRLAITGDMVQGIGLDSIFDVFLKYGLINFQKRHGLIVNGELNKETINEMNVSVNKRLSQLGRNKVRILNATSGLKDKHVIVNIPSAELFAIKNGNVDLSLKVIVGKIDRQTPLINSDIYEFNFYPYWHVPKSIVKKDIIKAVLADSNYLQNNNIHIFQDYTYQKEVNPRYLDWKSEEATAYKFRQDPGINNSMGFVKINFKNKHSVYLHDTPKKSLFNNDLRANSSGCVRIQNIDDLIIWILGEQDNWDMQKLDSIIQKQNTINVNLQEKIQIRITYITAWAERDGLVHFRRDVYKKDAISSDAS
ncbi:MAG: murein L,D-transpeptidase YcbB/YkuD [Alphaproteobacteria bacterium]|jgi:murein L,D-transpeptidase YcbB/YkuD|tara:strand:+ start:4359 stop:5729 length:1371 start_codon:yes stop_codon:yes gene_type:complete